jgi:serine/alanine adding enzyme
MPVELLPADKPWPSLDANAVFPRLNAHNPRWLSAICRGLKHQPMLLIHRNDSLDIDGLLPLAVVQGPLFGKFLASLPYLNTGGVWAETTQAGQALVSHACQLADQMNVRYLELRHELPIEHPQLNACRTDKVHMRLRLPATEDLLMQSFKAKLRSQVKKSQAYGLTIRWGGLDLLEDFYNVFAVNMRDLGTPVFSKQLFREILNSFPNEGAELCIVRKEATPVAAGLLVHVEGITEVPSASSLRAFNFTNANMWMYYNLLTRAIERGSSIFDFGRSSEGSGTYKFKEQWGAEPHQANWQYYVRKGSANDMRADAGGSKRLVKIWQKLPVWITRQCGPWIVRGIP